MQYPQKYNIEQVLEKMNSWYSQPLGQSVFQAERLQLTGLLSKMYGYHLVQFGGVPHSFFFDQASIKHKVRLSPEHCSRFPGPSIRSGFDELPLAHDSVDVMVLPHILEFSEYPKRVLSEAYRVLVGEGRLIIIGFNPYSIWGVCKPFAKKDEVLASAYFHSPYKVISWLSELGFEIENKKTGFFRFPFRQESALLSTTFLETMGQFCWPGGGAFYVIVAKKSVSSPTFVGFSWVKKLIALPGKQPKVVATTEL